MALPGWLRIPDMLNVALLGIDGGTAWLHTYAGRLRHPVVFWVDLVRGRMLGQATLEVMGVPTRAWTFDGGVLVETPSAVTAVGSDGVRWSQRVLSTQDARAGHVLVEPYPTQGFERPMAVLSAATGGFLGVLPGHRVSPTHVRTTGDPVRPVITDGVVPGGVHLDPDCSGVLVPSGVLRLTASALERFDRAGTLVETGSRGDVIALHPTGTGVAMERYAGPGVTRLTGEGLDIELDGERVQVRLAGARGVAEVLRGTTSWVVFFDRTGVLAEIPIPDEDRPVRLAADDETLAALWIGGIAWYAGQLHAVRLPQGYGRVVLWDGFPIVSIGDRLVPVGVAPIPEWLPDGGTAGPDLVLERIP
ncbi:MAG: hypothetical protein H6737_28210 [Alphaproteobacteria bacterium]|nr:hypothetical protein [Alphaproteobacteria bacterium]